MGFFRKTISAKKALKMVSRGENPRFIDLRGNYQIAIPGSIPVQFEPDIFFEDERWVQDMLGVRFNRNQTVIILCEFGHSSEAALDLFMEKNPKTPFDIRTMKKGMIAYSAAIEKLTKDFKKRDVFQRELLSLATPPARFHKIVKGLQGDKKSFLASLFS
jgi:hypothetical protein